MREKPQWEQPSFSLGTSLRETAWLNPAPRDKRRWTFTQVPRFTGVLVGLSILHAPETQNVSDLSRWNLVFCPELSW